MKNEWSGRKVTEVARPYIAARLPQPCGQCGHEVRPTDTWVVGHIKSRVTHPELTWVPSNWRAEHRACSDRTGQAAVIEKAKADALRGFPHDPTPRQAPPLPALSPEPSADLGRLIDGLPDPAATIAAQAWTSDLLPVPEDASLPLAMTGPHPRAVGSYGPECIAWAESTLGRRVIGGPRLRWWQKLAIIRQLEHDSEGRLVWAQVVESASRRSGKSVRLRVVAMWRVAHADLIGEPQEVLLTSKDLKVAREIIRPAWSWAMGAAKGDGWGVLRGNGSEEISSPSDDRWLVRASDSVYGYSPGCALADEAWGLPPDAITEGLEPALLERLWPQLVLTSTAHVKATSLMRRRLLAALRGDDPSTLLLLWGARPGADPGDPDVWRSASPFWSEARETMLRSKYAAALAGEEDPEFDDPDPMRGFAAQFLNLWPMVTVKVAPGDPLSTPTDWQALEAQTPSAPPSAVAVESWPSGDVSVAAAWPLEDGRTVVAVTAHPNVTEAAEQARLWACRTPVLVGQSLVTDPAWRGMRTKSRSGAPAVVISEFLRLLSDGVMAHDGSPHLADQVTATRTKATSTGLRITSAGPLDAVKSAAWAVSAARGTPSRKPIRIGLPSSVSV